MQLYAERAATSDDYDFLWGIVATTMRPHVMATWGQWDDAWQVERFRKHFRPELWSIVVVDGIDAGGYEAKLDDTELYVGKLHLLPQFQNRGIGTQIMKGLLDRSRAAGVPLALTVLRCNVDAKRFYERLGLRVLLEMDYRIVMCAP